MEIVLDQLITPFSLEYTLECGQSFRWERHGDWWYGVVGGNIVKIGQTGDKLLFQTFPESVDASFVEKYFRLDDDLPRILSQINRDKHIENAIQRFHGLRLTRQEPWECLISYICATNKNIPAIKNMIFNLSKRFGKKIAFEGKKFYTFPEPSDLADADLKEIRKCGLGFRAEWVLQTSKIIRGKGFCLDDLKEMSYEKAKSELLSLSGVGQKVADCVLLFSLDKLEAFPLDVWMTRTILEFYSNHFEESFNEKILRRGSPTPREYEEISSFGRRYFGKYAGYAQEYLFHYKRYSVKCLP